MRRSVIISLTAILFGCTLFAAESGRTQYRPVESVPNLDSIVKEVNRQMDRSMVVGQLPPSVGTPQDALAKMPDVIAQAEKIGVDWPRDRLFDPHALFVYGASQTFEHRGQRIPDVDPLQFRKA